MPMYVMSFRGSRKPPSSENMRRSKSIDSCNPIRYADAHGKAQGNMVPDFVGPFKKYHAQAP